MNGEAASGSSWDMPLPRSRGSCPEGTEGVVFIWTHFGGPAVLPKRFQIKTI